MGRHNYSADSGEIGRGNSVLWETIKKGKGGNVHSPEQIEDNNYKEMGKAAAVR